MIAARAVFLGVRRPTKFATPPNNGVFQQPSFLEIRQKSGNRPIHRPGMVTMFGQVGMLVPGGIGRIIPIGDLNKSHPLLTKTPRHETLLAKRIGGFLANPVPSQSGSAFQRKVKHFRGPGAHPPRQLIRIGNRLEFQVARCFRQPLGVEFPQKAKAVGLGFFGKAAMQVFDGHVARAASGLAQCGPLINGGKKSIAIIARAAISRRGADGDKSGQVFIRSAQSIQNPGTHTGSNGVCRSTMKE